MQQDLIYCNHGLLLSSIQSFTNTVFTLVTRRFLAEFLYFSDKGSFQRCELKTVKKCKQPYGTYKRVSFILFCPDSRLALGV
jgi:hypothetical protein